MISQLRRDDAPPSVLLSRSWAGLSRVDRTLLGIGDPVDPRSSIADAVGATGLPLQVVAARMRAFIESE